MLTELRVRDLATIADVTLPLGPGLNVLTGETGAGKSMLVDALALLLGARADAGAVRPGAARLAVEGVVEVGRSGSRSVVPLLEELGLELEEGRLVIRREVSTDGRSRAWVNGSPTTISVLSRLGRLLVDMHGQHDTQTLLHPEHQRGLLDAFSDAEGEAARVAEAWASLQAITQEEEALRSKRVEVSRRADYLRHVVQEIDAARIQPAEDESLDSEARKLSQAGSLSELAHKVAELVGGDEHSALKALGRADRTLSALEKADPDAAAWREMLDGAFAQLQELSRVASEYADGLSDDPERLAEIERRRDLFYRLKQKYGAALSEVLATRDAASSELELLDTADFDLRALADRRNGGSAELARLAAVLSAKRQSGAERLSRSVNRLLPKLGLPGGKVQVALQALDSIGSAGAESVRFEVRLNEGMEYRPLAKSASGGELSRLMLALKTVLGHHDAVPTLVFDEVDAGIGGEIGARVGEALGEVAERHQVLVITHLPQIAAMADRHLVVAKKTRGGLATSDVAMIHGEDRITELARMLGDPDASTARRHALTLLSSRPSR
ncbi:MAG TPA: DNA repair protein RecN [Gemmatimonadales bacterium]|nr:DNA repair protein RecN [Gemmatimonadales bacterium]